MPSPARPGSGAVRRRRLVALILVVLAAIVVLELAVGPASERLGHGADLQRLELKSKATGETLDLNLVVPDGGGRGRPLLVFLHGREVEGEESNLNEEMYAALAEQGERAPVVAFPDGGEASYWHDRADGEWGAYVVDEVIPRATKESGADPKRVAIGGISMGGFGALDIARVNPGRFCAVGGHSAALWQTGGESAPGAFDDADDFERHDVIEAAQSAPDPYLSQPVWIDSGEEDPFRPGIDAFAAALKSAGADLSFQISPGGHGGSYWADHWDDYMRFYARALSDCKT